MPTSTTKTAACQIKFDGHDYRNRLTVKSPTGRAVVLDLVGSRRERASAQLVQFVRQFEYAPAEDYQWGSWTEASLSYALMAEIKALAA